MILLTGLVAGCVWPFQAVNDGLSGDGMLPPAADRSYQAPAAPMGNLASDNGRNNMVNRFLWRATLDTISFMPVAAADPYGGVIITDWLATPENPNERFKLTVYILDSALRADAIKVAVFRQTLRVSGIWADAAVDPESSIRIENTILSRARQLRLRTDVG